mmetsp:Transcript_1082/g.2276  ORF Transcript_1082/g.2276 Transcript_1082/m.2276 type:complete len:231 (+) Transcript_1082:565-1257(+)
MEGLLLAQCNILLICATSKDQIRKDSPTLFTPAWWQIYVELKKTFTGIRQFIIETNEVLRIYVAQLPHQLIILFQHPQDIFRFWHTLGFVLGLVLAHHGTLTGPILVFACQMFQFLQAHFQVLQFQYQVNRFGGALRCKYRLSCEVRGSVEIVVAGHVVHKGPNNVPQIRRNGMFPSLSIPCPVDVMVPGGELRQLLQRLFALPGIVFTLRAGSSGTLIVYEALKHLPHG